MKRNFFMMVIVCLFTVVALSSCQKDDDDDGINTINVVVENGNNYNALIDAVILNVWDYSMEQNQTLVETEYKDGGFTINLPESVSSRYLEPLDEDMPNGITVSNKNVNGGWASFIAFQSDEAVGYFYCRSGDWIGELMYVDGNSFITGIVTDSELDNGVTYTATYNLNMNLKKGWNMVYEKYSLSSFSYTSEITTTTPANAKWYFESYDYYYETVSGSRARKSLLPGKQKIRF
ncbi:MAG: hypothetical protein LBD76_04440 [Prevotellaceae bacterium]|jgi:hypothetical protein|nr:hypothetical protein [Prevotellaceae bacterium]